MTRGTAAVFFLLLGGAVASCTSGDNVSDRDSSSGTGGSESPGDGDSRGDGDGDGDSPGDGDGDNLGDGDGDNPGDGDGDGDSPGDGDGDDSGDGDGGGGTGGGTDNSSGGVGAVGMGGDGSFGGAGPVLGDGPGMVSAGSQFVCAILEDGTGKCWGKDFHGQLGNGADQGLDQTLPVRVVGLEGARGVSAGESHACATLDSGRIQCWGKSAQGQIGNGVPAQSHTPRFVDDFGPALSVTVGDEFSCALAQDKTVWCWGKDSLGAVGNGAASQSDVRSPVQVPGLTQVRSLDAGSSHVCAARENGTVYCWGSDALGQCGGGAESPGKFHSPHLVSGISTAREVTAGDSHSCAVLTDDTVVCWGEDNYGQIGDGMDDGDINYVPTPVVGLEDVLMVSAGDSITCALLRDGSARCWGSDWQGVLGNGVSMTSNMSSPSEVLGLTDATFISAGGVVVCAAREDASLVCWGYDSNGQLGDDPPKNSKHAPVRVAL